MPARIRPAQLADIEALLDLESGFPEADRFDRRTWRRLLTGRGLVLVHQHGDAAPSGSAVVLYRTGSRVARLYSIAVAAAARGRGVGRGLLDACESAARTHGCQLIRLEVRQSNCSAIRLYQMGGYRVIGVLESYYPDGEAALRMEKSLNAPFNGAP